MIDMQQHLLSITKFLISDFNFSQLRGVLAKWGDKDHTVCISFYFNGPIVEQDKEEASDLAGGIIAHFPDGLLEEHYIRLDCPKPLPNSPFWAYKRHENE